MGARPGLDHGPLRFGVFELHPASGELRKHGIRLRLQEQPLKLLLCLLETPGEIWTREDLIKRIWPDGTFVDYERGLNSAVTRLRQAIGDSADAPRYVETVGRRGYRFIAPVERPPLTVSTLETVEESASEPASQRDTPTVDPPVSPRLRTRFWPYLIPLVVGLVAGFAVDRWPTPRPAIRPLMRFGIDLENGMTPAGPGTALALSPDGTRLALALRCADGKIRLVTRRIEESRLTPLPGTEGASSPFFSPDGQSIAYFADNKLEKISFQGGTPVPLADAATFFRGPRARSPSGNWGDDGNIIAMLNPGAGLARIPSAGGPSVPLKGLNKTDAEVDTWPQVLPGSQAVLFTRYKGDYDSATLQVFVFRTGELKTILNGGFFGRYLPDGHLIYIRRNTLYAVAFDLKSLAVAGNAQAVVLGAVAAQDINSRLAVWSYDFSRTGSFAYLSHQPEPRHSLFWIDNQGRTSPLPAIAESSNGSPRFSPDGRRLAFSRNMRGQQDIWVLDLSRGALSRLTSLPGANDAPVWTADSQNIVFRSVDQPHSGIYGVRADGSAEPHRLLDLANGEFASSISPDGRNLALWAAGKIWVAPVQSDGRDVSLGKPALFLQTRFNPTVPGRLAPAFSPDGHWLAYCSNESEQIDVYVVPFPGPGGKSRISTAGGVFPVWAQNGRELFYQDLDSQRIMVVPYKATADTFAASPPRVWSDARQLELGVQQSYDVAPDGKRLITVLYEDGTPEWKRESKVAFLLNFFEALRPHGPSEIQ